jgi:hypothetical protein
MSDISRRTFFKHAGLATAAVGAAAVVPAGLSGASVAGTVDKPLTDVEVSLSEPIVAHVTDARNGLITLYVGTREVHIKDRSVTARIVRAAR